MAGICRTRVRTGKRGKRTSSLASSFNDFFNRTVGTVDTDYYGRLSAADYVELKIILSNINNIITLHVTLAFAEWLYGCGIVDAGQYAAIRAGIEDSNANANGYDVQFYGKIGAASGLVAEVKCNIPVGDDRFGAAQLANLKKDIDGLMHGKAKAKGMDPKNCLKFLVLLDDGKRVRKAAEHFVDSMRRHGSPIIVADRLEPSALLTDTVYVIILKIKDKSL